MVHEYRCEGGSEELAVQEVRSRSLVLPRAQGAFLVPDHEVHCQDDDGTEQHEEIKRLDEAGDDALRLEDIKMKLLESKDFRDLGLDARRSLAINLHGARKGHCDVRHSPWLTRIVCSLTFGFAEPLGGLGGEFNPGGDAAHAEHSVTMVIQALNDLSRKCKEQGMGPTKPFSSRRQLDG